MTTLERLYKEEMSKVQWLSLFDELRKLKNERMKESQQNNTEFWKCPLCNDKKVPRETMWKTICMGNIELDRIYNKNYETNY